MRAIDVNAESDQMQSIYIRIEPEHFSGDRINGAHETKALL